MPRLCGTGRRSGGRSTSEASRHPQRSGIDRSSSRESLEAPRRGEIATHIWDMGPISVCEMSGIEGGRASDRATHHVAARAHTDTAEL